MKNNQGISNRRYYEGFYTISRLNFFFLSHQPQDFFTKFTKRNKCPHKNALVKSLTSEHAVAWPSRSWSGKRSRSSCHTHLAASDTLLRGLRRSIGSHSHQGSSSSTYLALERQFPLLKRTFSWFFSARLALRRGFRLY